MIILITGAPGTGKTASAVELLRTDFAGRRALVDGVTELALPHEVIDGSQWHEVCQAGDVIVVDEAQRIWRPASAGSRVPASIEAMETHRHMGVDIIVMTQAPALVHANIRRLVGRHVMLRSTGITGRWLYEWPECSTEQAWRTAPVRKSFRLPKAAFALYKSAELHTKVARTLPRSVLLLLLVLPLLGYLLWSFYGTLSGKLQGKSGADLAKPAAVAASAPASAPAVVPGVIAVGGAAAVAAAAASEAQSASVGCIATPDRCMCFDASGAVMALEWGVCQTSARTFGGVVRLEVRARHSGAVPTIVAPLSSQADPPSSPQAVGITAGDFRFREQRQPVNAYN